MTLKKVSFKVPPELWSSFATQANGLSLLRGQFLNDVMAGEVEELKKELNGRRLSLRAKKYISGLLKKSGAKSVNIELAEATVSALNEIVQKSNLVRDAFLCRLLIFLRGSDALLNHLEVPLLIDGRTPGGKLEALPTSPLKAMEAVKDDPMFYIRNFLDDQFSNIYTVHLPEELNWAACFLEDVDVPGSKENKEQQRKYEDLFDLLEQSAFVGKSAEKKGN